jgi:hypothetical protein
VNEMPFLLKNNHGNRIPAHVPNPRKGNALTGENGFPAPFAEQSLKPTPLKKSMITMFSIILNSGKP